MIKSCSLYLFLCLIGLPLLAAAQIDTAAVDSIAVDTTTMVQPSDSTLADSAATDSLKPLFKVIPWEYHAPLNTNIVSSDSTLRWQIWPNWTYKTNRDPGVISYRLGTTQRNNAFLINAQEPRYQRLYWEDVNLNDPVSGAVHWDLIPQHKIKSFYADDEGTFYDSNYFLKQYYLNKPLTQLNYEESKFDYRSLEFVVSQNFSQRTNAEISYWDRRDGGEYPNSAVEGRQIFTRVFHQLDHRQAIKLNFLNNKYTIGEPFGYVIPDLNTFAFDRFSASANENRAASEINATTLSLNYYRRGEDTTRVTDDFHAGAYINNRGRSLEYSRDSTFYNIRSYGVNARKWVELGPLKLEGGFFWEFSNSKDRQRSNMIRDTWRMYTADAKAEFSPFRFIDVNGGVDYKRRSDGFDAYSFSVGGEIEFKKYFQISAEASLGTVMPTLQQLYWSSVEYSGNSALVPEDVSEVHADISSRPFETLRIGIKGQFKEIENGIMVGADSSFANMPAYQSASVTPYFDFENRLFEFSGSATYHRFTNETGSSLLDENERIWLKGSAYIKGYLFNRATYVKAGLAGMLAPMSYRASHYNPVLDYWQPLSSDQLLPAFNRLDVDISARVRDIMVLLRWENVLNEVNQLGYYEAAGYPMTGRRFIFGMRVFFRN